MLRASLRMTRLPARHAASPRGESARTSARNWSQTDRRRWLATRARLGAFDARRYWAKCPGVLARQLAACIKATTAHRASPAERVFRAFARSIAYLMLSISIA